MTKVIVIDDEQDITEVFCEYLELKDIAVVGRGYDGKDAAKLYQRFHPDVVLMDLVMPKYDGIYGIQKIREQDPSSKIIIFSASLTPEYIKKLKELEVSGITRKPYDMDAVIGLIKKVVSNKAINIAQ